MSIEREDGSFNAEAMRRDLIAQRGPLPASLAAHAPGCLSPNDCGELVAAIGVVHAMSAYLCLTMGSACCDPRAVRGLAQDLADLHEAARNLERLGFELVERARRERAHGPV